MSAKRTSSTVRRDSEVKSSPPVASPPADEDGDRTMTTVDDSGDEITAGQPPTAAVNPAALPSGWYGEHETAFVYEPSTSEIDFRVEKNWPVPHYALLTPAQQSKAIILDKHGNLPKKAIRTSTSAVPGPSTAGPSKITEIKEPSVQPAPSLTEIAKFSELARADSITVTCKLPAGANKIGTGKLEVGLSMTLEKVLTSKDPFAIQTRCPGLDYRNCGWISKEHCPIVCAWLATGLSIVATVADPVLRNGNGQVYEYGLSLKLQST